MLFLLQNNKYTFLNYFIEPNLFLSYLWLSLCFICFIFIFSSVHIITSSLFFIMLYLLLLPFGFFFELEFIVLLLLIVYVGAIAIFFIFIIMSLNLKGFFLFPQINWFFYFYFFIFCFILLFPMFYILPDFAFVSNELITFSLVELHLPEMLGFSLFYENLVAVLLLMILFFFIMVSIPLIFKRNSSLHRIEISYNF